MEQQQNQSNLEQAPQIQSVDIKQEALVHDTQYDYYGKRLAICSSDGSVTVFDVNKNEGITQAATFKASEKNVWQVAWAHPQYGSILATCSYDKKVSIWQENQVNKWVYIEQHTDVHQGSVNTIQWAPSETGLILAAGSSDGIVGIYSMRNSDDTWNSPVSWQAHEQGINGVAWQPNNDYNDINLDENKQQSPLRLITASCDETLIIWDLDLQFNHKKLMQLQHSGWVRDVAWSSAINQFQTIASCSENHSVKIWKIHNIGEQNQRVEQEEIQLEYPCWRVSWSLTGSMLAVSSATQDHSGTIHILKENENGKWDKMPNCIDLKKQNNINM